MHGVVRAAHSDLFVHRNLLDIAAFEKMLRRGAATGPFVGLADAVRGRGDALTIDDATQAGREAALMAREFGHAVSLFVNPFHVESRSPYWTSILNVALDEVGTKAVVLDGRRFPMATPRERELLRVRVKREIGRLGDERDRLELVREIARKLGAPGGAIPRHLEPITIDELLLLRHAGVAIENHGWDHTDLERRDQGAALREIVRGRDWIARVVGREPTAFAVPFGRQRLLQRFRREFQDFWCTLDDDRPALVTASRAVNRHTLRVDSQRQ